MNNEAWRRLVEGKPLKGLGLASKNGRIDLRGSVVPSPSAGPTISLPVADVTVLQGSTVVKGAVWQSLDFSGSRLDGLRFIDCVLTNCVFDECSCKDIRFWSTTVSDSTFRSTDLRQSVLGAVQGRNRNTFRNVNFSAADLRQTVYVSADFQACWFSYAKLDRVDFQGSTFANCTFEGELREVLFYRKGFKGEEYPPNKMVGVDFSRGKLRWCAFRGLDLDDVTFPNDEDHIVLNDYPEMLDRLLRSLRGREDVGSKRMVAVFTDARKWAGNRGILNKKDLLEMGGEAGLKAVLEILSSRLVC